MAKWRGALAVMVSFIVSGVGSVATADGGLSDFVNTYQCSLAGLIAKIVANPHKSDTQDRFIILSLPGPIAAYVQCAFDTDDREGICEASSILSSESDSRLSASLTSWNCSARAA